MYVSSSSLFVSAIDRPFQSRNMAQIAALEAEMAKIQKALDSAKATYSSLQKQYQEQCGMHFPAFTVPPIH